MSSPKQTSSEDTSTYPSRRAPGHTPCRAHTLQGTHPGGHISTTCSSPGCAHSRVGLGSAADRRPAVGRPAPDGSSAATAAVLWYHCTAAAVPPRRQYHRKRKRRPCASTSACTVGLPAGTTHRRRRCRCRDRPEEGRAPVAAGLQPWCKRHLLPTGAGPEFLLNDTASY